MEMKTIVLLGKHGIVSTTHTSFRLFNKLLGTMDSKDLKQMNRFNTEMHTLRKAEEDTKYFWNCVDINFETCDASFPNLPSKEELFNSHLKKETQTIEDNIPVERSGLGVEKVHPIENFDDLIGTVPDFIIENINYLRYEKPTPVQKHAVPLGMTGRDLIVCSHTVRDSRNDYN